MKIEGKIISNLRIDDLNEGDVFSLSSRCNLYMKTDELGDVNAVRLADGHSIWVGEDEEVFRVNGKFVIEGC